MCFSPQGDLAGGIVVTTIGVDACRHLRGRKNHLMLAALPLLLGIHQIDEAFVWWSLQGHVPHTLGRVAMWIYLVIALVVVPIFVPLAIFRLQATKRRRLVIAPFLILGVAVGAILLEKMIEGPISVKQGSLHLAYSIGLQNGLLVIGLYVVATCGSLLFSGYRDILIFGLANVVAVVILARLTADGFASLWCFYAALASGAITLHMRYSKPHRENPFALT